MGTPELKFELHQLGQKSLSWPPGKNLCSRPSPIIVVGIKMVYSANLGQPVNLRICDYFFFFKLHLKKNPNSSSHTTFILACVQ